MRKPSDGISCVRSLLPILTPLFALSLVPIGLLRAQDPLEFTFTGKYGQVEVGGPYVGVEFHNSQPLPSRLSFYAPVANSIDLSTDYWKRGTSAPLALGVRVGNGNPHWIGKEPWSYILSPHRVTFRATTNDIDYRIAYEFCKNQPAMVFSVTLKNRTAQPLPVELYAHLLVALRTCQTYARRDSAWTEYDTTQSILGVHFDEPDTRNATVFVQNTGLHPVEWTSSAEELGLTDSGYSNWVPGTNHLQQRIHSGRKGKSAAAFVFRKNLGVGDSMTVVQVIGSCDRAEMKTRTAALALSWLQEVRSYDEFVRGKAERNDTFLTGDAWLDRSAVWARAILATNAHFLENRVVPMPCPAEYNFFFTHDLLMTNLGAVNCDAERVRDNLLYVVSLAKDHIIPHAYYWRDDGFKTEYCTPSNWNHLWFVMLSATYYRHSQDESTARTLLPFVTKSVEEVLTQRKQDNLMYAYRPDWWDIGWNEGPRAYITALTIRALREYVFLCAALGEQSCELLNDEALADSMQSALEKKLWDEKTRYLTNYNSGVKDPHFYMGSLLAPVFGALGRPMSEQLVETAGRELVDDRVGVRNAMPPDFHTDSSKGFYKFADDEAGRPYVYANGGVWPHNNAWYVLALQSAGRPDDALRFLRTTMTVDGVAQSPKGQPAMYEYRFSDPSSPDFGAIDKPSFLWAGGFYLCSLYRLLGFTDNEWNISLSDKRPTAIDSVRCSFDFGRKKIVTIRGTSKSLKSLTADGRGIPSLVLPMDVSAAGQLDCEMGDTESSYLQDANAIVKTIRFEKRTSRLESEFSSFEGHRITARFVTNKAPKSIKLDGKTLRGEVTQRADGHSLLVTIRFVGGRSSQKLSIVF